MSFYRDEERTARLSKIKKKSSSKRVDAWLRNYGTKGNKFAPTSKSRQLFELEEHWESKKPQMRALSTKRPLPPGHVWGDDDFHGNVEKAERELFIKLIRFMQGRGVPALFRRMNGNGDGRLELNEWITGCRDLVGSKASEWMLTEIFELMDGCDDPASEYADPDNCLSYAELFARLTTWRDKLAYDEWLDGKGISRESRKKRPTPNEISISLAKPKEWRPDDCNGVLEAAEKRVFGVCCFMPKC